MSGIIGQYIIKTEFLSMQVCYNLTHVTLCTKTLFCHHMREESANEQLLRLFLFSSACPTAVSTWRDITNRKTK